jgi:predicted MPP superfamily phosphohydrolase
MLTFVAIVTSLWALLHLYVARRLIGPLETNGRLRLSLYGLFVLLFPLSPAVFFTDELLAFPWNVIYGWIAWTYMGAFSVLFALIAARDVVSLALKLVDVPMRKHTGHGVLPASLERRRFMLTATGSVAVGSTGVLSGVGIRTARSAPEVVEVEVPIDGLPEAFDGYHIVQISDIHVGDTIDKDFILPVVEKVTDLRPDLVAVTGDIVDGSVVQLRDDISPLAYLRAKDGVLCVTGNHEYYSGADEWCAHFEELGMQVLNNRHITIEREGKRLLIAGVTDLLEGKRHPGHASDPALALAGAPAHDTRILLAHQPRSAFEASKHGYALQLSGHTHGGQFFPWNLVVGLVQPVVAGLEKVEGMWVYVNRGTCYWGPPMRTGVPSEITSLRLRRRKPVTRTNA